MSERVFRTGEVWLCESELEGLRPREIIAISGGFVHYKDQSFERWVSASEWNSRAKTKLGVVRRFLGIRLGITK